jgi:PAS domain S-box-containing protein
MSSAALDAGAAPRQLSIRALMFLLVLTVLLPSAVVAAWFLSVELAHARATAEAEVRLLVDNAAAALQLTLSDQQAVLKRFAERPNVKALDPDHFDPGVAEYIRVHPEYNNLGVRDRQARLVFSGRPGPATPPEQFRRFPWFEEGLAAGQFMASDAFKGTLSNRWVTVLTHPVRDEHGGVAGLVHLSQDLLALNRRILGAVPPEAVVAVTDRQGRHLLHSADPVAWLGTPGLWGGEPDALAEHEGIRIAAGSDGVTRLYAFSTMADTGWHIIAGLPQDQVFAIHSQLLLRSEFIGAGIMVLALLLAWRVGRAIVGPVDSLSSAAARVAAGDDAARARVAGPAEIRTVAAEFNRMVQARADSESALRDSENSLAVTLQSIADAVIATDLAGRITRINATAAQLTGWPVAQALGRPLAEVFRIVHSETGEAIADPVQAVLASGVSTGMASDAELCARDGARLRIADSAAPIRDDAGSTLGVVLVFSDITERARAEQELRAHAQVLRARDRALAEVSQGVMMTDAQARITYVNPGFERLTGYRASEVLGRSAQFMQGPATSPATVAEIKRAVRDGSAFHGEALSYRKDGSTLWLALDISPLHDEQGMLTGFVGAQRDISERKQAQAERRALEAQLRESQKMEAIGTLAGGIAHDFNNMLGAILGNAELARGDLPAGHPALAGLEQIKKAGTRARDLVQQILTFSRRQPHELLNQPLRPLVEESLALLRSTLPARVQLKQLLGDDPVYINADATQIQQVLMNLCTNAWHALREGTGVITVGLGEVELDSAAAMAVGALVPGRYAHLWVRDTGTGMDAATRRRIFDPFFTTKPVGAGTGLGLSVVHGIVTAHHGAISVDTELGKGSTFHLYFPSQPRGAQAPAAAAMTQPAVLEGHGEHVLYVDDDEVMLIMVERLLQRAGYRTTCCQDAQEALLKVRANPQAFDIVVTDYNMPAMSGLELAQALASIRPDLPVVISSGYLSEELRSGAQRAGVRHLMQKQNAVEELSKLVRRALAQ